MKLSLRTSLLIAVSAISLAACETTPTQADLDNANAQVLELTAEVTSLKTQITALDAQLTAAQTALDQALADGVLDAQEIADLQADVKTLEQQKGALQAQLDAATKEAEVLTATNQQLAKQLKDAQDALDSTGEDVLSLTKQLADTEQQLADYNKTAFKAVAEREVYTQEAGSTDAILEAAQAASDAADDAVAAMQAARAAVQGAAGAQTLAQFFVLNPEAATIYADTMGLNLVANADDLVVFTDNNALTDFDRLSAAELVSLTNDQTIASNTLLGAQTAYDASFGGIAQTNTYTMYDAAGREIRAEGAGVYVGTSGSLALGDDVPLGAEMTAMYLIEDGAITDVLVWDAASLNPFAGLPVGAASYRSDNMIAYFAEKNDDGTYTTANAGGNGPAAGSLTFNFATNTGFLTITPVDNDSINANNPTEYGIAANLVFDPTTGTFSGNGTQAYDLDNVDDPAAAGADDVAAAVISGSLGGAADTFAAEITATDTTTVGGRPYDITIVTGIVGNGTVTIPR